MRAESIETSRVAFGDRRGVELPKREEEEKKKDQVKAQRNEEPLMNAVANDPSSTRASTSRPATKTCDSWIDSGQRERERGDVEWLERSHQQQ